MPDTGSTAPASCRFLGHRYSQSYELLHDSGKGLLYRHSCERCTDSGPALPASSIIEWRHNHGLSWAPSAHPRLEALRLSVSYSARTLWQHAVSLLDRPDTASEPSQSDPEAEPEYERPRA